eukprot:scaffold24138_cov63-Phaeocystis_antarctica.AAC.1
MRLAGTICGRAIRTGARWWPTAQGPAVVCAACQAAWCRTAWSVVPWGCVGSGAAWCLGEYSGIVTGLAAVPCGLGARLGASRVAWVLGGAP